MAVSYIVNEENDFLHERVRHILRELNAIEENKARLQAELLKLQTECQHEYVASLSMKTCCKCQYTESIY